MLAGEITNVRNAMYTRYTYFNVFFYIVPREGVIHYRFHMELGQVLVLSVVFVHLL